MKKTTIQFSNSSTDFYFAGGISNLKEITDVKNAVFITDENVFNAHRKRFKNYNSIVLKPGEEYKVQQTVDSIIDQLIEFECGRKTVLIGVGGGVITDITGYAASVFMRGIKFGFVPTTLLGLVDASIGGKNGIDVGMYKNMVGIIRQPSFILHDLVFLNTLPESEWQNGFAEIIKHACIKDAAMFKELQANSLKKYQQKKTLVCKLIQRNALIKIKVVQHDELENGERRLLNFGHTLGHALENQYELPHGQAVATGMAYACKISEQITGFKQTARVIKVIEQYGLPAFIEFDKVKAFEMLKMDKKRESKEINYILLDRVGQGVVKQIELEKLNQIIQAI